MSLCPCGSGLLYEMCCGPYHKGENRPDALTLMRSRYSAYAKGEIDYIIATTHPKERKKVVKEDLEAFSRMTLFEKLEILKVEPGDTISHVTFRAHLRQGERDASFTERSLFEKINGVWFYLAPA